MWIDIVIWCLVFSPVIVGIIWYKYLDYRDKKICDFRAMIAGLCLEYDIRHLQHEDIYQFMYSEHWFLNKYNYEQMLFSIKPLKLEYWYTKEELDKIYN